MKYSQAKEILTKYSNGTCTEEEQALVEAWYEKWNEGAGEDLSEERLEAAFVRLTERLPAVKRPKTLKIWPRIGIAAAVIGVLIFGGYLLNDYRNNLKKEITVASADISPGKNSATLTLADGKQIRLSDASYGELAKEAGVVITKAANGQLVYEIKGAVQGDNSINTLHTEKGETYQVRLPDGTLVYLNAASNLTYKASLIQDGKRMVKLDGEGYFEVAKDKQHPFVVTTNRQVVEVLGTHFNVNSYADETAAKTTLLEGSIKLNTIYGHHKILKPGEQAILSNHELNISLDQTELAIAWKNNKFMFESASIQEIMRMIERWYNVEIIYEGDIPVNKFGGSVSKFENVSKVLEILESTKKVHFEIEGRRILVRK